MEQPYASVGSSGMSSFLATAEASFSAITASTPQPRCGPCCSVAPTGRIAAACAAAKSEGSSSHVRSSQFILFHVVGGFGETRDDRIVVLVFGLGGVDQLFEPRFR